ncbi:helix-turn-helix domain-containing protein [Saccharopolyspora hordei]|uniref:Transcriptional regulator with XRE-family HTH domain n=1 Tax=Saccharopolyspora hordei TaxID=1838 RepID=A0A853AI14_9PSEU|nr:helix-turn-helix transcriptional regulator [Saccharopolyspora hordei]NYI82739.1 transcriptional regulator with XRE-family HTH domain [Saccharopolyspora hordei]
MAPVSPTVAAWALGLRVRDKREEAGLSGAAAAKRIGIAAAYLSDVERGKKNLSADRLEVLIEVYDFHEDEAEELRSLREQATRRGWWNKYTAIFSTELLRFFGFEHGADSIHTYDSDLVNGLLQTEDYARAIIESGSPNVRLAEVDRRVAARLTRQKRLTDDPPLHIVSIMSEAALRQQIGGPRVLAGQLMHLERMIETMPESLSLQIVPFEATGHHAMGGSSFHLMSFPSGQLPTLLWQETVTSTQLISDQITVREYSLAHAEATKCALSREDSLQLIRDAYKRL